MVRGDDAGDGALVHGERRKGARAATVEWLRAQRALAASASGAQPALSHSQPGAA